MMFMSGSERAAHIAIDTGISGIGLHVNFSEPFSSDTMNNTIREYQSRIVSFLGASKYHRLLFNPWLTHHFKAVYQAQFDEFVQLYKRYPSHIDGHHHMHLCTNMMLQGCYPKGLRLRTTHTFASHEKNIINRLYRNLVSYLIYKQYKSTDCFYDIEPIIRQGHQRVERLREIVLKAGRASIELMAHPERQDEYDYLMSGEFAQIIERVDKSSFEAL
jgi:predicted glycoside hydrolase/deacetylase ChbG (UPF0249 family)